MRGAVKSNGEPEMSTHSESNDLPHEVTQKPENTERLKLQN